MSEVADVDVILIGAGVMSATLAVLLRKLAPEMRIVVFERQDRAASESSDAWNNAGTGHSGFCELNYTPRGKDGSVDVSKAIKIASQFQQSLELWQALVEAGDLPDTPSFVRRVPHMSFVWGASDVAFLKERYAKLIQSPLFHGMEYSEDHAQLAEWMPLIMEGRSSDTPLAATRMGRGADVNFGALSRAMLDFCNAQQGIVVELHHEVKDITRDGKHWRIDVKNLSNAKERSVRAPFVFIGAGGYSLNLLEKSGIPEAKGYGAFPVSGQWLKCKNKDVIARHHAKVYGQAEVGAPPMSVPHLDTRWISDEQELLFGPYAGITTKFLKQGSWLDLLGSIGIHNIRPIVDAGLENMGLTRYLVGQAMLNHEERVDILQKYMPSARDEDWEVQVAGLRVQIIKNDGHGGGELRFGTEVVASADGSIAALLGASPGASTAVAIMTELLARCFPERWKSEEWRGRLAKLVSSGLH
ncbi:malate:quinone oxidoreductase [soil metagenome]